MATRKSMKKILLIMLILIGLASFLALSSLAAPKWPIPEGLKTIEVNGYDMAYQETGSGIPLVLVHGTVTDYRYWGLQMEPLASSYRVIAPSLRHFYPERWNGEGSDFSVEQHAKDLAVFIKGLHAGPVHLVGHSRGGDVALLLAKAEPGLLLSLTLADPAPLEGLLPKMPEAAAEAGARRAFVTAALERLQQSDVDGGLEKFVDGTSGPGAWKTLPEPLRQALRENVWSIKSLLTDAQASFTCADAAAIKAPVLLITGERSPRPYGVMLESLASCLKRHKKVTIPNASHAMNRANPQAFNAAVLAFLANPQ